MGERSRHKEYCQLRQEIRGSDEYLTIGIDVSKDRHHAFFGTARGRTVYKRLVFENSYQGFKRLIDHAKAMLVQNGLEKMVFGLEPTGDYHKPLANFLITNGYCLVLVSGVALKRNRELLDNRWDKNDTKDSANIADLISQGKCLFYEYPSNEISTLRSLLSLRKRLKMEMHGVKMRIRNNLIAKHFPEMDRHYNETCIGIVRWALDPKKISSMDFDSFFKMTSTNKRQEKRFRLIYDCAKDSIGLSVDKGAEYDAIVLTERFAGLSKSIKEVESKIEETAKRFDEYKYLLTIPGFGALYARCPKLYYGLAIAKADGSYARAASKLAKTPILILDDFGLAAMTDSERRDLLEIIDDRHESASTIITSQLPVEHWHETIGDPTIADALLDRLVHNAHKIKLTGKDSMRKKKKED
jgi:transposase